MLSLKDNEGKAWGVYVYHNGSERVLYTRVVDSLIFPPVESIVLHSFDGSFDLKVGNDGSLYTYPRNRNRR